jgi:hypothetical protein
VRGAPWHRRMGTPVGGLLKNQLSRPTGLIAGGEDVSPEHCERSLLFAAIGPLYIWNRDQAPRIRGALEMSDTLSAESYCHSCSRGDHCTAAPKSTFPPIFTSTEIFFTPYNREIHGDMGRRKSYMNQIVSTRMNCRFVWTARAHARLSQGALSLVRGGS